MKIKLSIVSYLLLIGIPGVARGQNRANGASNQFVPISSDSVAQKIQNLPTIELISRPVREIPAHRYLESAKSEEHKSYQASVRQKFEGLVVEIAKIKSQIDALKPDDRSILLPFLSTAEGNRSVVRTKMKPLDYSPPDQWPAFRVGIDEALKNLEQSVELLNSRLPDA